jgi:hypothetical protein
LHNRLGNRDLDQEMKTDRHLTTWTDLTNEPKFNGGRRAAPAEETRIPGIDQNCATEPNFNGGRRAEGGRSRAEDGSQGGNPTSGRRPKLRDRTQFRARAKTVRPNPISGTEQNAATEPNFGRMRKLRDRTQFRADTRPGWWQPVVIHGVISQFQISDTKPQTPTLAGMKCQISTNEANCREVAGFA